MYVLFQWIVVFVCAYYAWLGFVQVSLRIDKWADTPASNGKTHRENFKQFIEDHPQLFESDEEQKAREAEKEKKQNATSYDTGGSFSARYIPSIAPLVELRKTSRVSATIAFDRLSRVVQDYFDFDISEKDQQALNIAFNAMTSEDLYYIEQLIHDSPVLAEREFDSVFHKYQRDKARNPCNTPFPFRDIFVALQVLERAASNDTKDERDYRVGHGLRFYELCGAG